MCVYWSIVALLTADRNGDHHAVKSLSSSGKAWKQIPWKNAIRRLAIPSDSPRMKCCVTGIHVSFSSICELYVNWNFLKNLMYVSTSFFSDEKSSIVIFQYDGLRRLFHNALSENNLLNDGDFDWVKRLQEHRLNRSKTATIAAAAASTGAPAPANTTVVGATSTNGPTALPTGLPVNPIKNINATTNASSSMVQTPTTRNNNTFNHLNESRTRSTTQRSAYHTQLPLSSTNRSTNATTATLNGGSKTTLSMASTGKIQATLPSSSSSRTATENHRPGPPPTKRRGLVPPPPPLPYYSYHHTHHPQYSANVNNSNNNPTSKGQHSSVIGPPSEPTCCFFKRKAKRALQITSTTPRRS